MLGASFPDLFAIYTNVKVRQHLLAESRFAPDALQRFISEAGECSITSNSDQHRAGD